jgi:hypothetical protein
MDVDRSIIDKLDDYSLWNEGKDESDRISLLDYACFNATPDLLIAVMELLNPTLINHEGSYFIKTRFDKSTYDDWKKEAVEKKEVEKVMNHIHVTSIFQNQDLDIEVAELAAILITNCWNREFENLSLEASVIGDSIEDLAVTLNSR